MNVAKLYLNENLSWKVAHALRKSGFDVVSSHDTGLNTTDDETQMAFAIKEERAIVTNNFADFRHLDKEYHARGENHHGKIFTLKYDIGTMIRLLGRLLDSMEASDLKNQIHWLSEFR